MKHYLSILLCILLGCSFVSCEKEVTERPYPPPYVKGRLADGGRISEILLTTKQYSYPNLYGETISSYSELEMELDIRRSSKSSPLINPSNYDKINELQKEYVLAKSAFIQDRYDNAIKTLGFGAWNHQWPNLYTAYVNGEVTITCDKPLFGEEPGTNLSKYLKITSTSCCLPVGVTEPYLLYDFGDSIPTNMHEYFIKEAWLQLSYKLYFCEAPSEKYDDLTLRISIPMIQECCEDYILAEYYGHPLESKYKESTFTSSLKIKFDWK